MELPSRILEKAVDQLSTLPGVGKKSALRFALDLLDRNDADFDLFVSALQQMKSDTHACSCCHLISDDPVCPICNSPKRDKSTVCVVATVQEVMAIERTAQYNGVYHVLGGVISPIDGIGVNDLFISDLFQRVEREAPREVILALPTTMEGDTTNFYIYKRLKQYPSIAVTTPSRGVAVGDNLEYADEVTLGRSLKGRVPFEKAM